MRVAGETPDPDPDRRLRKVGTWWRVVLLVAVGAIAGSCSRSGRRQTERRIALSSCRVEGIEFQTLCGTYEVFEDRVAKQGRKIPLRVVVVPALAASAEPDPLVPLAGGPGQAASEVKILEMVDRIHRSRDIL